MPCPHDLPNVPCLHILCSSTLPAMDSTHPDQPTANSAHCIDYVFCLQHYHVPSDVMDERSVYKISVVEKTRRSHA